MTYHHYISTRQNFSLVELGQSRIRLAMGSAGACWYLFWILYANNQNAAKIMPVLIGYFIYAVLHWYWVRSKPDFNRWRMYIVTFCDQAVVIYFMFFTQELGFFFVFSNPWISIGNGIRFGKKWMLLSATIAISGFITLGLFSNFWQQSLILLLALLILNATVPAYVAALLIGLEESRTKLAIYADEMEKMALRDGLTGLPNRSALFAECERVSSFADRNHLAIALIYFDLDGFKTVNDTYGHMVGDLLLKETAIRVSDVLRNEDLLARLGGDEFVVLLQGQNSVERANLVAVRILQAVLSIKSIHGDKIDITASVGGIVVSGPEATGYRAEALLHEADKNMYKAKRSGKNQIVLTGFNENSDIICTPEVAIIL